MIYTGFGQLDKTCGLEERQPYLLQGETGSGKTTFALTFLAEGLRNGETVALVTQQDVRQVLECAHHFGLSLSGSLRDGKLAIFEYPPDIVQHSRRILDDAQIVGEFRALLAGMPVKRLVFDPVTPLLAGHIGEAAAARFRTLVASIGDLGATTIYVAEGGEEAAWAGSSVAGVIHTSTTPSGNYQMTLQRWQGAGRGASFEYELMEGLGLTASEQQTAQLSRSLLHLGEAVTKPGAPRILMIGFEGEQAAHLRSVLSTEYGVDEAFGPGDGVAYAAERGPSIVLLSKETGRISGSAMARKLRQAGHNMPIFLIGRQLHRTADQANLLTCGIDLCLNAPVHGRLLRLHIDNFLRRTGRLPHPLRTADERAIPAPPLRETVNCTTKLEYFCERVEREMAYNAEIHLPLQAFVVRMATGKPLVEELSGTATMATRSTDLVFAGKEGIAILLSEALSAEPFLTRFAQTWRGPAPLIEPLKPSGKASLSEILRSVLGGEAFHASARQAVEVGA